MFPTIAIHVYRSSPLVPLDSCLTAAACLSSACSFTVSQASDLALLVGYVAQEDFNFNMKVISSRVLLGSSFLNCQIKESNFFCDMTAIPLDCVILFFPFCYFCRCFYCLFLLFFFFFRYLIFILFVLVMHPGPPGGHIGIDS